MGLLGFKNVSSWGLVVIFMFFAFWASSALAETVAQEETGRPSGFSEQVASIVGLTQEQALDFHKQFRDFIKEQGFSDKVVAKAYHTDTRSLLKLLKLEDGNGSQKPDWEHLRVQVNYWRRLLPVSSHGVDQLEHFLLKTQHSNAFHPFTVNLPKWESFLNFMVKWQVFTSVTGEEARSFKNYVITSKWLEGAQTSQTRSPEFWAAWDLVFERSGMKPEFLGENIYNHVMKPLKKGHHSDGIQSLYLGLSPTLLATLSRYPQYVNPKLLGKIFTSNIITVSIMAENIEGIFAKYDRMNLSDKAKATDILRDIEYLLQDYLVEKVEAKKRRHGRGSYRCKLSLAY